MVVSNFDRGGTIEAMTLVIRRRFLMKLSTNPAIHFKDVEANRVGSRRRKDLSRGSGRRIRLL